MRVLTVNAGSSSLKLSLLGHHDEVEQRADLPADHTGFHRDALVAALSGWDPPDAVAHRIVHGGATFTRPVRIDAEVTEQLRSLIDLAPLHQPKSLGALAAVTDLLPNVPAVACFDTAFHATIPDGASTYAVLKAWRERYGIRRYGFHGLSHAYASRRAAELLGRSVGGLRTVTCHLGAGASLCAVLDGYSVDTTMGFTPLEGLVMATRSGSIDPGLLLWLEEHEHLSPHEVAVTLEERSGLTALAGTGDMEQIEAAVRAGDPDAQLALDVYLHRLVAGIASMAAATGGIDVLVFTGGVGEHSAGVRSEASARLGFLGVGLDWKRNSQARGDTEVTSAGSRVHTVVVAAREDLEMAGEARQALGHSP